MFEQIRHPNVISCHPGRGLDGEDVYIVMTNLPTDPEHPDFDEGAYKSLEDIIRAHLEKHPEYDRATIVPK